MVRTIGGNESSELVKMDTSVCVFVCVCACCICVIGVSVVVVIVVLASGEWSEEQPEGIRPWSRLGGRKTALNKLKGRSVNR